MTLCLQLSIAVFAIKYRVPSKTVWIVGSRTVYVPRRTSVVFASASVLRKLHGQKVNLIAHVMASGPVPPTGMVIFKWRYFTTTYTIGTATLNSAGVATLTKSNLNANLGISYPMSAVYRGDTNNLSSTSPVLNQTVLQTTSAATLTSSVNPSTVGQAITFTAKFTSPTVIPSGPVTFKAGTTVLGTALLAAAERYSRPRLFLRARL